MKRSWARPGCPPCEGLTLALPAIVTVCATRGWLSGSGGARAHHRLLAGVRLRRPLRGNGDAGLARRRCAPSWPPPEPPGSKGAASVVAAVNACVADALQAGWLIFYTRDIAPTELPAGDSDR